MSKLEELINELCPNGVNYLSIGSVITRIREKGKENPEISQVYVVSNTQGIVRAEEYRENTIHSEDTSNYTIIRENMVAYNPSRLNIGSIARLKSSDAGLVSPMYVVFSIDESKMRYEYFDYMIKSSYVVNKIDSFKEEGARYRFDFSRWDWILIPIPPLEIQDEIVRILNTFKGLTAELTAELTARKKQYEYYRDYLLGNAKHAEYLSLNNLAKIKNGKDYKMLEDGEIPVYGSGGIMTYVNQYAYDKPSVLIPRKGSIDKLYYVTKPFWNVDTIFYTEIKTETILPKYLYYLLQKEHLEQYNTAGGVPSLTQSVLNKIELLVPPLEEQERIVSILDRFDSLCNDISIGLPAEIKARQKQYEYYRDKLLTFKRLED